MQKGFRELVWVLDILLHARREGVHLVLAGTGSDEQRVRSFARRIEVTDHVHFLGPCPDLAPWLARADLVCVPSLRPGGAGAALEAMAAGKAVVASRHVGLEEIVLDSQTGYLAGPGDKADLARQLHRLLEDADCRQRFGEAGRARAADVFTAERLRETCAQLYQRWPLRKKTSLRA
jgi:glycosyltransferase involved in cell wall biosynthesis